MARTFLQTAGITTDLTTYTFSSQNFGTASGGRHIIVAIFARDTGDVVKTIDSVTIGGVAATIAVQGRGSGGSNSNIAGIAIAAVPTGTSGDVVVTFSEQMLRCGLALYGATDISGTTPHDFDSDLVNDPLAGSLDIPAGGIGIGAACRGLGAGTAAWTNLTEDYDTSVEGLPFSGASDEFVSTQTGLAVSCDFGGSTGDPVAVFASWGPAGAGGSAVPRILQSYGGPFV